MDRKITSPNKAIWAVTVIMIVTSSAFIAFQFYNKTNMSLLLNSSDELRRINFQLIQESKDLNQCIKMSALSGYSSWENSYFQHRKTLQNLVQEGLRLEPQLFQSQELADAIEAEEQLNQIAQTVFSAIRHKNKSVAIDQINSLHFEEHSEEFAQGISKINGHLNHRIQALNANINSMSRMSIAFVLLTLLIYGLTVLTLYRALKEWGIALEKLNSEIGNQLEARTREVIQQQKSLAESYQMSMLGKLSAGIAHEINNPLSILLGRIDIMTKKIEKDPKLFQSLTQDVQNLESTANRLRKIVAGLKTFSRKGDEDPHVRFKLKKLIEESLELCIPKLKSLNIELRVLKTPEIELFGNQVQVSQAIVNLVTNAADAIESLNEKWIQLSYLMTEKNIEIQITDSGHGISPELAEKIMQPFFTTKGVGKGTGLGLSLSKGFIEEHGGTLTIDHRCPNTRFVITLPLAQE